MLSIVPGTPSISDVVIVIVLGHPQALLLESSSEFIPEQWPCPPRMSLGKDQRACPMDSPSNRVLICWPELLSKSGAPSCSLKPKA